ncbi:DUF5693 family protein [Vallitalea okinawensis]|uniref:DUF5693 family protein n=1 Tax=Vallitalea okinawensis TaxID=2078660 RepID=UPI000CFD89A4|nr:DUF5693 family protein [Vallitalea okinawensis]
MSRMQKIILAVVFVISFIIMSTVLVQRMNVESEYKTYSIILDYNDMTKMANESEEDLNWWMEKLGEFDAEYVGISEETLQSLQKAGEIEVAPLIEVKEDIDWVISYPETFVEAVQNEDISDYDLVVATRDTAIYNDMIDGMNERYGRAFYNTYNADGKYVITIDSTEKNHEDVMTYVGIYYDEEKINTVKTAGLEVLLRPFNYEPYTDQLVEVYKDAHNAYNIEPSVYMVAGKEVLGYGAAINGINELAEFIVEFDMDIAMVEKSDQREHLTQTGMDTLLDLTGYNHATRAFTTWEYIQERYAYLIYKGPEEITNTYYRAITERNIRYIYFKPFIDSGTKEYVTDLEDYEMMFTSLRQRLEPHGIVPGDVQPMDEIHVDFVRGILINMGLVVVVILLINGLLPLKELYNYILLGLGFLFIVLGGYVAPNFFKIVTSLVAAVGFPTLAGLYMINGLEKYRKIKDYDYKVFFMSLGMLIICVLITLIGGFYVGTILTDSRYLLELEFFRGVKLSLIAPIFFTAVYYFIYYAYGTSQTKKLSGIIYKTEKLFDESIKVKYLIALSVLGVAAYIFLARSGHETNVQPMNLEIIFRNFLEQTTLARPRNKEFLIAYPSLILLIYVTVKGYRPLILPFALLFSIGFTDVVNTFCHIRSPLYLSIARIGYGLVFGIVLGIIYLIGFMVLEWLIKKLQGFIIKN